MNYLSFTVWIVAALCWAIGSWRAVNQRALTPLSIFMLATTVACLPLVLCRAALMNSPAGPP